MHTRTNSIGVMKRKNCNQMHLMLSLSSEDQSAEVFRNSAPVTEVETDARSSGFISTRVHLHHNEANSAVLFVDWNNNCN